MARGADLFLVCKNCGSEVSPYVTECPYCGQRVRKRAPKIPARGEETQAPKRRRTPTLPRLRRDEIPGIAPETRPYATGVLVTTSVVVTILWGANVIGFRNLGVVTGPIQNDWWRLLSTTFIHDNVGVIFATMLATAIFGTHLERRFGPALVVGTVLLCGAGRWMSHGRRAVGRGRWPAPACGPGPPAARWRSPLRGAGGGRPRAPPRTPPRPPRPRRGPTAGPHRSARPTRPTAPATRGSA